MKIIRFIPEGLIGDLIFFPYHTHQAAYMKEGKGHD